MSANDLGASNFPVSPTNLAICDTDTPKALAIDSLSNLFNLLNSASPPACLTTSFIIPVKSLSNASSLAF